MDQDDTETRTRLLDAAEELFYARGVHAVGMDDLRAEAGVSLKRLYRLFPAKDDLLDAYLRRRDARWRGSLARHVEAATDDPAEAPLAVFDWLAEWFSEPGFRGCAFLNSFGELGATNAEVAARAREHVDAIGDYLAGLVAPLGLADPAALAAQLLMLVEGAIACAATLDNPAAAATGRTAAAALLAAAPRSAVPRS